jgi:hypothetical protein
MRNFNYAIGAIITITLSLGSAAVTYGSKFIIFDVFNLPAWILGPLGIYTLIYALTAGEFYYNFSWSLALLTIAIYSAFYRLLNFIVVLGIFLIAIAVISSLAILRSKKPRS